MVHPHASSFETEPKFEATAQSRQEKIHDVADPASVTEMETQEWVLPSIDEMLDESAEVSIDEEFDRQRARVIEDTLSSFGAPASVVEINRGPTITQFGVEPGFIERSSGRTRVRVGKISALADDLALALAASRIRIQAPVPGKGFVGIEVPNEEIAIVALRNVIESQAFTRLRSPLRFALGQDVSGNAIAADLAGMPHLLIAGATGSGKSVCVNAIINCLLLHNTPEKIRMVMVDPKRVELTGYNGIPHLLAPVVVELERVVGALQWVLREMDQRYHKFAEAGARNIIEYNSQLESNDEPTLPYLIVVIDELADLMMLAPDQTERALTRLAQLARATGIHLIVSTQRPSVDVVTGLIKANFPARIAFAVASNVDSRVILDQPGAERLLGRGDMLFQAPDAAAPVRLQGVFVSDIEIMRVVQYWRKFSTSPDTDESASRPPVDAPPTGIPLKQIPMFEELEAEEDEDPVLASAIDLIRREGRASISMLQRRLRIGYTRAARLIDTMEERGIIGPPQGGAQAREVLDYGPTAPPQDD
jgi:S-DNA-T family DNA segregation ATPase FtsK/SpoIIIE